MQGTSWITLFRRIPANLHDGLILSLTTGSEVVVQRFIKLDPDVMLLRGRMAGTQDSGRVVILPYSYLVAINFTRRIGDAEVETIFGKNTQPFAANITLSPAGEEDEKPEMADLEHEPALANGHAEAAPGVRAALPSKAELLAKLRARLGDAGRPVG
jgi:hypothetical protein